MKFAFYCDALKVRVFGILIFQKISKSQTATMFQKEHDMNSIRQRGSSSSASMILTSVEAGVGSTTAAFPTATGAKESR